MASHGMPDGRKESTTARPPPEQGLRCPRCDSPNTKFCYYNNYNLSQPRHFCKACRRYWTKGGALRNVPVGGGCRKNKKAKAAAAAAATRAAAGAGDSDGGAGLRFLHGGPVELQLSGLPFSRLNSPSNVYNQFFTFGDLSSSMIGPSSSPCGSSLESPTPGAIGNSPSTLLSFGPCPMSSPILRQGEGIGSHGVVYGGRSIQDQMGGHHVNMQINSIASSIASLSSMNQDLHLKLQQQRFAMLFGGSHRDQNSSVSSVSPSMVENQQNHPLPISFHTSESSKISGDHIPGNRTLMVTATDNLLESSSQELQTWSDMHQFS